MMGVVRKRKNSDCIESVFCFFAVLSCLMNVSRVTIESEWVNYLYKTKQKRKKSLELKVKCTRISSFVNESLFDCFV